MATRKQTRLIDQVDELGRIKHQLDSLKSEYDILRKDVIEELQHACPEGALFKATEYSAQWKGSSKLEVDLTRLHRIVGSKKFLDLVNPKVTAIREELSAQELAEVADEAPGPIILKLSKVKGEKGK